jgi:hypothetical protein
MGKHESSSHGSKKPVERVDHRPIRESKRKHDDPYHARAKPSDARVCRTCGVTSYGGKWSWHGPPLADVYECTCPACQRIHDGYPAGRVELHGVGTAERKEIESLIRNVEATEKAEHPLERLMSMREEDGMLLVTTTGVHLGRAIAGALGRRFHGRVSIEYPGGEDFIRVRLDR